MKKKFIQVEGIQIACHIKNDDKKNTIFFIHGNSGSSLAWRKQTADALFSDYRLIAIDLPAHGFSGAANGNPSIYSLPGLAEVMAKVVQQLANGEPFIIMGSSLGTNIVAEMMAFDLKPAGLVMAGPCMVGDACPIEKLIRPGTNVHVVFLDEPDGNDVKKYSSETSASTDENDQQLFVADFIRVSIPFRSSLAASIADKNYSDEIKLLQEKNIPLLVVFGKEEKVIDASYLDKVPLPLWRDKIYKLPCASHLLQIDQPQAFNDLVKTFAEEIFCCQEKVSGRG